MLRPSKSEIEAVTSLLAAGAHSPDQLAYDVIQKVEALRGHRQQWFTVFELSPGVYQGYGPYPTRHMALKATPKLPMAQVAQRGAVVPMLGPLVGLDMSAADEPPAERGDFALVREDAQAFRNGWGKGKKGGNLSDRAQYLTDGT